MFIAILHFVIFLKRLTFIVLIKSQCADSTHMRELDRRVLLLAAHAQTCFGEAPDEAVSQDEFAYALLSSVQDLKPNEFICAI